MADAGRVIAGTARGTRLVPAGPATRPLGDRVKQTLFAILEPGIAGQAVLDLFAGTGAAGIEALSRGAGAAVFVDSDPAAIRAIRANLERAGLASSAVQVVRADALRWLAEAAGDAGDERAPTFGLVIVDPPYERADLVRAVLERLGDPDVPEGGGLLAPGAVVVAKTFWRDAPPPTVGLLASERTRRFGETALTIYRRRAAGPEAGEATEA